MRVLFVNPPVLPSGVVPPPLSVATLSSYVAPVCTKFRILDYDLLFFDERMRSKSFLLKRLDEEIDELEPDVVLFTSMYNNSVIASRLIERVKERSGESITIAGGPHFGAQPELALACLPDLDFVIAGEGENALRTFLERHARGGAIENVPNLTYRSKKNIIANAKGALLDLKTLPNVWRATRNFLDLSTYVNTVSTRSDHRSIYIEAGRGCPYQCNFCAPAQFWDRRYRVKSPEQIADEIRYLHEDFGFDAFILVHDLLTVDSRFVENLCEQISALDLPIRWMANSRTDLEKARDFSTLAAAGCWRLFYGIDSASPRIQREMGKNLDPKEAFDVVRSCLKAGIGTVCSFVIGHPSETSEDLSNSILLGARLKVIGAENVQFHRLRLFPPAPLATGDRLKALLADAVLDETTLRLEFPFPELDPDERHEINQHPNFYSGYFPPSSEAGSAEEISQIELFFTQAVAFAPLTVYALGTMTAEGVVNLFRCHLRTCGYMDRYLFDPTNIDVLRNWVQVHERLQQMISASPTSPDCKRLVRNLLVYEDARMRFVHREAPGPEALVWTDAQAVIRADVAVDDFLGMMVDGQAPTLDVAQPVTIIFTRNSNDIGVVHP